MAEHWTRIDSTPPKWLRDGDGASTEGIAAADYAYLTLGALNCAETCQPFEVVKTEEGHVWRPHVGADRAVILAAEQAVDDTFDVTP